MIILARTGRNPVLSASTKIDFILNGELADRLEEYIRRGYFATKPEAVRQALRHLFTDIDEKELQRARLRMMEK